MVYCGWCGDSFPKDQFDHGEWHHSGRGPVPHSRFSIPLPQTLTTIAAQSLRLLVTALEGGTKSSTARSFRQLMNTLEGGTKSASPSRRRTPSAVTKSAKPSSQSSRQGPTKVAKSAQSSSRTRRLKS